MTAVVFTTIGVSLAPSAAADTSSSLRAAIAAARGTSCGAMRYDPVVEQAADKINATTNNYIDHTVRYLPDKDPLPILKDLGYGGNTAVILSGAGQTDALAIKGLLLSGYDKIPDCQYTNYGVNAQYNATKDLILTTVVLAG